MLLMVVRDVRSAVNNSASGFFMVLSSGLGGLLLRFLFCFVSGLLALRGAIHALGFPVCGQVTAAAAALVIHALIRATVPAVRRVPHVLSHRDGAICPSVPTL